MDIQETQTENMLQSNSVKETAKNLTHLLILYLLAKTLYGYVAGIVLLSIASTAKSALWTNLTIFPMSNIAQLLTLPIFLSFYKEYKSEIVEIPVTKHNFSKTTLIKAFIFILAVNFTLILFAFIVQSTTGYSLGSRTNLEKTLFNTIFLLFTSAVMPALIEEFMFRFVIYRYLRKYGIAFAAVTSSVLFGLIHMSLLQFILAIFAGIAFCYVYEASGKLRYPVLLHFMNNAFGVMSSMAPLNDHTHLQIRLAWGIGSLIIVIFYFIKNKSAIKEKIAEIKPEVVQLVRFFKTSPISVFSLFCLAIPLFGFLSFIVK